MPRIPDEVLDCTVFLYPTGKAAQDGEHSGGSGFLVAVPSMPSGRHWLYIVTASHVVKEGNSPVVRLNTIAGDVDVLPFQQDNWLHHPDGDDVAVVPVLTSSDKYRFRAIDTSLFLTPKIISEVKFGHGDDVFMVGRFVTHEGGQQNLPTARFGTVAMMTGEPITHQTRGIKQESYLIEMHSIPGYSGSPVFLMFLKGTPRHGFEGTASDTYGPFLVGLDWCHLNKYEPVVYKHDKDSQVEDYMVKSNLGMAGVLPSWKIREVLDLDKLKKQREKLNQSLAKAMAKGSASSDVGSTDQFTEESSDEALKGS